MTLRNSSPRCHRCKISKGSIIRWWKPRWTTLHRRGTELDPTHRKRMNMMSYIAKESIPLNWKHQRPPSFSLFKQIFNETSRRCGNLDSTRPLKKMNRDRGLISFHLLLSRCCCWLFVCLFVFVVFCFICLPVSLSVISLFVQSVIEMLKINII